METYDFEPEQKVENPGNLRRFLREMGLFMADIFYNALVIIILVVLIRSFLISPFRVVGSSMANTLENKEFILINKLGYIIGDIDHGDPIVFLPPPTSKDAPKFEEIVQAEDSGVITFDFSELQKTKTATYCKNAVLKSFWFCQDKVKEGDHVYFAPQVAVVGNSAKQTEWNSVTSIAVSKTDYKNGFMMLPGEAGMTYAARIYDSKGPEYFVKRVIGLPGDTVKIDGGRVYLKGPDDEAFWQIDEPFLNAENLNRTYISQKHRQNIYKVPEGHYFVMGDNRNHSNDSRSWLEPITQDAYPFVPEDNVYGKVMIVLWPITDMRLIHSADF